MVSAVAGVWFLASTSGGPQPPLNCSKGFGVLFWPSLSHTCGILTHTGIDKNKSLKKDATPESSLGYTVGPCLRTSGQRRLQPDLGWER